LYVLVNGKLLLNRMVRGNNLVGPNREYILAHPRERKEIRQRFINHALGYLYYIQTEGGMPELGLAHDEFADNGHIPYQIYVREGRRIEGAATLTEADLNPHILGDGLRPPSKPDVVAIGDWTFESQGCADAVPEGYKYPDGYLINRATRTPYQIPYGCLLPKGVSNLLVCGAVSASHIALGAVRCEAARIQMGIAAGVAAGLSLHRGLAPADVPVPELQAELLERGGKLTYFADVESDRPHVRAIQWAALRGVVPADPDWCFSPDHPAAWGDFVEAVVTTLGLPISVTGAHFEGVSRLDRCYRFIETLYDLGTRAGVDLFGLARLQDEDPMKEFLRLYPRFKLLPFSVREPVSTARALRFLADVAKAGGADRAPAVDAGSGLLTRGAMCGLLESMMRRPTS